MGSPIEVSTGSDEEAQVSLGTSEPRVTAIQSDIGNADMPTWQKNVILFVVSWMTLAITWSSTSLLVATPEIALELITTVEILNVTNACTLIAMGSSSLIWGPLTEIWGRRICYNLAIIVMLVTTIGAAVAPNMVTFTVMRLLGGFTGTFFMVAGQTIIADIFEPTVRGRAVGFFMIGGVAGTAIGPCFAGIIVTFAPWRYIYWVQAAMVGLALVLSLLFVPHIQSTVRQYSEKDNFMSLTVMEKVKKFNPSKVIVQLFVPRVFLSHLTCGLLAVTQYGLLTSVRTIINPRFNLTTPLVSGLFYISPGAGFLAGSVIGGRLSDMTVRHYIKLRGTRLPRDRLNGGLVGVFLILPTSMLIFGWTLQQEVGGLAVPIISAFWIGIGLMGTFNGLNTYAAEVQPELRSETVAAKYLLQYVFSAASSAAIVPLIDACGVGWTFTILVALALIGGLLLLLITKRNPVTGEWEFKLKQAGSETEAE